MAGEGEFPKTAGDVLYASDVNKMINNSIIAGSLTNVISGAGTDQDQYYPVGRNTVADNLGNAAASMVIPRDGTIKNFTTYLFQNSGNGTVTECNLYDYDGGSVTDTGVGTAYTSGESGLKQYTGSDLAVSAGEQYLIQITFDAGTGDLGPLAWSFTLE